MYISVLASKAVCFYSQMLQRVYFKYLVLYKEYSKQLTLVAIFNAKAYMRKVYLPGWLYIYIYYIFFM